MAMGWEEIERAPGFGGIRAVVEREILPSLENIEAETTGKDGEPKGLETIMSAAFGAFAVIFFITFLILPETFLGILLRFILFPILFFGTFVVAIWLNKKKLTDYLLRTHGRFQIRGKILSRIAGHLGLNYVANPGNRPAILDWLVKQSWVPPELREAAQTVGGTGEMTAAVQAVRDSGLALGNVIVIGNEQQKAQYHKQLTSSLNFEDGFHGERNGIAIDILEWVEKQDEADDIYHLIIVFEAPRESRGVIQLKSRKASWWRSPGDKPMQAVKAGPETFHDAYDVRADDQVEAHALFDPAVIARMIDITHGDRFRASAIGDRLVFDLAGENRFAVLDPSTGEWSDETLRQSLSDLSEALALVDALAEAFRVRKTEPAK